MLAMLPGLTVMEEQLIQCNTEEARPSKRGKMEATTVSLDTSLWIEMARSALYYRQRLLVNRCVDERMDL